MNKKYYPVILTFYNLTYSNKSNNLLLFSIYSRFADPELGNTHITKYCSISRTYRIEHFNRTLLQIKLLISY